MTELSLLLASLVLDILDVLCGRLEEGGEYNKIEKNTGGQFFIRGQDRCQTGPRSVSLWQDVYEWWQDVYFLSGSCCSKISVQDYQISVKTTPRACKLWNECILPCLNGWEGLT